jgi:hypothetical protein
MVRLGQLGDQFQCLDGPYATIVTQAATLYIDGSLNLSAWA